MPSTTGDLRSALARGLKEARSRTDEFFALLEPTTLYARPIPERHRVIFYLGHLEAFDWNLLGRRVFGRKSFHAAFDQLFAFGIDPVGGGLPTDLPSDWPTVDEVLAYNKSVRASIDECLASVDFSSPNLAPAVHGGFCFQIAIEHRLMHAETLAYKLAYLPTDGFRRGVSVLPNAQPGPTRAGYSRTGEPGRVRAIEIPAGRATLGAKRRAGVFGWDNEFEDSTENVPAFAIDARNVTNGEFLEFVRAGCYRDASLYSDEDRAWISTRDHQHPACWRVRNGEWFQRASFAEVPLPLDWPVQVSLAEARAFARWRGGRLPTEAEFHRAAYGTPTGEERQFAWGETPPDSPGDLEPRGNFNFLRWDPSPVAAYPAGDSAFQVSDLCGNGWEWTDSVFAPFTGFQPVELYPGYSEPFFDGKHYVIKGASARTDRRFLRRSFRNWFQPHYAYVFAAFRCVNRGTR